MIKLVDSQVVFNQEEHTYSLGGIALKGITGMIKSQLFPDMYKDIPQYILDKAAERGTMVHESIELFDAGFEPKDTTPELESYKRIKRENDLTTLANEYIVTDKEHFASAIDLVLCKGDDIILTDIKTTYTLDKEYVRWQLSIYAYLFELQNPELKVSKLYALWLRDDKSEFTEIKRVEFDTIKDLLQCEVEGRKFNTPTGRADNMPSEIKQAEKAVYTLVQQIKELNAQKDKLSKGLLKLMQDNDVKTYKGEYITLSRKAASTREDIDKKKLKDEYPEAYAACMKITNINESLQIR